MTKVSEVSFGKIYTGGLLKQAINENSSVKKQADSLIGMLRKNNCHKTKNVDVYVQYDKLRGFFGVISSKKQGTPYNPAVYSPQISKQNLSVFKEWLQEWDDAYNPRHLKEFKKLKALLVQK